MKRSALPVTNCLDQLLVGSLKKTSGKSKTEDGFRAHCGLLLRLKPLQSFPGAACNVFVERRLNWKATNFEKASAELLKLQARNDKGARMWSNA